MEKRHIPPDDYQIIRIFICGAHSVGKTTLAHAVAKETGFDQVSEVARTIIRDLGLKREDYDPKMNREGFKNLQILILKSQAEVERSYDDRKCSYICDRAIDPIVYAWMYLGEEHAKELLQQEETKENIKRYQSSMVFVIKPFPECIKDDDVRLHPTLAELIGFTSIMEKLLEKLQIKYVVIDTLDMNERVQIIMDKTKRKQKKSTRNEPEALPTNTHAVKMVQKPNWMDLTTKFGYTLPSELVDYRSAESQKRLIRCMSQGSAVPYFHLSSCFKHQSHPTYCGISTLVVVLNSLGIDPKKTWKTPWRWFTEEVIERSFEPNELASVRTSGITVSDFQRLAEDNGASCTLRRAEDTEQGYEEFVEELYKVFCGRNSSSLDLDIDLNKDTTSHELNQVMAVSWHRESLNQHGNGHFSPVAAYDTTTNSVLVLDTARFKYPPYWAPVHELYRSMIPEDSVTGLSRGYLIVGNPNSRIHSYYDISSSPFF